MSNAVTKIEPRPQPPASDVGALMAIIDRAATDPNFDPARLMQLLEVKERWEATEARKAYMVAMAAFKADPPKIFKNKHVAFRNKSGGLTEYDHATHSEVVEKIAGALGQHGLSHRWNIVQDKGLITVTCVITHALGHSDSVAMTAPPDDSGSKSAIQAVASTCTLLQRYTLIAATGLTSADLPDADDRTDGDDDKPETIGPGQLKELETLITAVGADKAKFLTFLKVDSLDKILVASYATAKSALESKRPK